MSKDFFVHPTAIVSSSSIGSGSRIWAFCNVQKAAVIGADVNICDHCFVENNVIIGDRCTIKNAVSLWDGVILEDDVFIGPNAVFTNDVFPRSQVRHDAFDKTLIRQGATIGAGAVIVAGHTIGRYAFVAAGAVVTKNIPDFNLWQGNPARFASYVCKCARKFTFKNDRTGRCECGEEYELRNNEVNCTRSTS